MASPSDWKTQLSFSERLSTILKISAAFQLAFPESSDSNTRTEARRIEDDILQRSLTKSEYEKACRETTTNYCKYAPEQDFSHDEDLSIPPKSVTEFKIGAYEHCTYHKSGLFSTIYRGFLPGCSEPCAIKATTPGTEQAPHSSAREARLLRKIAHLNVIKILEVEKLPNGQLLMSFPFMPLTLEDVLASNSRIDAKSTLERLFQGLDYLHRAANILHRDLKPSNILLTKRANRTHEYDLRIADFGIAWHKDDPDSEPPEAKITDIGTTCYRAPELLFGCRNYKEGVDLWSAGCIVAEILMHKARLNGNTEIKSDWTLFDAGEVGSELALVKSIFETLGTPDEQSWPECTSLPDWGKMSFVVFPRRSWADVLLGVDELGIDIVANLVQYQSTKRIAAAQVLSHPWLTGPSFQQELPSVAD